MIVAIVGSRELWVHNLGKYLPEGVTVFFSYVKAWTGRLGETSVSSGFQKLLLFLKICHTSFPVNPHLRYRLSGLVGLLH